MNINFILVYLFTFSEIFLLILKRSKTDTVKSRADKLSLLLFWITIPVCFITGDVVRNDGFPIHDPIFRQTGIVLFAIGFILRWVAIFQLGNMFTVDVSIVSGHQLKTDGLYSIVRHPSYTGLLLIITGISFFMSNLLSCAIIIIPIFLATNYRIAVEEKALIAEFGEQYIEYKKRVRKIIPFIY